MFIDEIKRLAALDAYQILDTPPEPAFEDVVLIARELCNTPIALVSLVAEDRQWFKARIGLEACETPLSQSVCAHAVAQQSMLIVPDLTKDARTKDNTLVTGAPFIRFYAGALLTTPGGDILGTLCVIDTEPRPSGLTDGQIAGLEALARQVMLTMEMRRAVLNRESALEHERDLRSSISDNEARSMAAQQAGQIGTFEIDVATDTLRFSSVFARIAGLGDKREMPANEYEKLVIADDAALVSSAELRRGENIPLMAEYRIRRMSDGAVRWLVRHGGFIRDENGISLKFTGTIQDITDRKGIESRLAALAKLSDDIRDADKIPQVIASVSRIVGVTVGAVRAGYAHIDLASDTFRVDEDWSAPGAVSLKGVRSLSTFGATIDRVRHGEALIVANIPSAAWLGDDLAGYRSLSVKAQIKVPLMAGDNLVGLFFVHDAEPRTWTKDEIEFVQAAADRSYAAIARIEAEQQRQLLNQELSHRLKNTLALVQAIATQTLKGASDRDAVHAFRQRLMALSRAHDVLLQQSWAAARIRSVIEGVLPLHVEAGRLALDGPNIFLGPKAVLSLSMLLHELATNAVKHGSLSVEGGTVALNWTIDHATPEPTVVLKWDEKGGPAVVEPVSTGMGSRLIKIGLAGTGDTDLHYTPLGLTAEFRAPLALLTEN